MPSSQIAYCTTVCALWAFGAWNAWECLGLYSDGAFFMTQSVQRMSFWVFDPARDYIYAITQTPLVIALHLGVTDLHWLARLYSAGLIIVPTGLYHLALARVRHDTILLAVTIAAVAMVFMTTSFFIVGEYNTACAIGVLIATRLASADKPRVADGVVLVIVATLALRTYETFLYLGPLLAGMVMWTAYRRWPIGGGQASRPSIGVAVIALLTILIAWQTTYAILLWVLLAVAVAMFWGMHRPASRATLTTGLYLLAAALLLAGALIAANSLIERLSFLADTIWKAREFWSNAQFVLMLGAALAVAIWGLLRPDDLRRRRLYIPAFCLLLLLALSPVLASHFPLLRPHGEEHYTARNVAGVVVAAIVVFLWARTWRDGAWLPAFAVLKEPAVARNLLGFSSLMFLAVLPSAIFLTTTWISFLAAMQTTVRSHRGVVALADTAPARPPYVFLADPEFVVSLSLAIRATPEDGIVIAPTSYNYNLMADLPDLGGFVWRD